MESESSYSWGCCFFELLEIVSTKTSDENKGQSHSSDDNVHESDVMEGELAFDDKGTMHQQLWDPIVSVPAHSTLDMDISSNASDQLKKIVQYFGKVVYIDDEVHDYQKSGSDGKEIIGRLDYNKIKQ